MSFKKTLFVSAAVAVTTAGVVGLNAASAATDGSQPAKVVDKIVSEIKGEKGQSETIRGGARGEHQAQQGQNLEARLAELVREGKITEEQKAKILAKHAELKAQMEADLKENLSSKGKEGMRALAEERRAELEAWAQANGIPVEYLHLGSGVQNARTPHMTVELPSGGTSVAPNPANR